MKDTDYYILLKIDNNNLFSLLIVLKNKIDYKQISKINKVFNKLYITINNEKILLNVSEEISKYLSIIKDCFLTNEEEFQNKGESLLFKI